MAIITGQAGTVVWSGTTFNVTSWEFTPEQKVEETTHAGSGGYQANVPTYKAATGSFTVDYDSAVGVPGLGSSVAFTLTAGSSGLTITGNGYVTSMPIKNDARGLVSVTAEYVTTSTYVINL